MHGAVEDHRRAHAFEPERADEGGRLPMPVRDRGAAAGAMHRAAIAPGHLGRGAGLVDEHQPFGVEIGRLGDRRERAKRAIIRAELEAILASVRLF